MREEFPDPIFGPKKIRHLTVTGITETGAVEFTLDDSPKVRRLHPHWFTSCGGAAVGDVFVASHRTTEYDGGSVIPIMKLEGE